MNSSPRIVVVGGSGFIGTRLVSRLLAAGHTVRVADKAPSGAYPGLWVPCDVRDMESLKHVCAGYDTIYNLAAEHRDDVRPQRLYHEVNVGGAAHVCTAAEALGIQRIIFTSTVAVYGFAPDEVDEATTPHPFNEYGRSKLEAEEVYRRWVQCSAERSLAMVRLTATFGEGNRGNFYNLVHHVARQRFVMVGPGTNKKSIAYVENVAALLQFLLDVGRGEHLWNYADKPDLDMNSLVRHVRSLLGQPSERWLHVPYSMGYAGGAIADWLARVMNHPLPISRIRVRKFCENSQVAAGRAHAAGFRAPVSIEEAIARTIRAEFTSPVPVATESSHG